MLRAAIAFSCIGFLVLSLNTLFKCETAAGINGDAYFLPKIVVVKSDSTESITRISTKILSKKTRLWTLASSALPLVTGIIPFGPGHGLVASSFLDSSCSNIEEPELASIVSEAPVTTSFLFSSPILYALSKKFLTNYSTRKNKKVRKICF